MGKRGPAPKPTAMRHGYGRNSREPTPVKSLPDCPDHLTGVAREQWERIGRMMCRLNVMTEADGIALEMLCESYANYRSCLEKVQTLGQAMTKRNKPWYEEITNEDGSTRTVRREGSVDVIRNPFSVELHKYKEELHKAIIQFGMTPSSRTQVAATDDADALLKEFGIVG